MFTLTSGSILTWAVTNILPLILGALFKAMADRNVREQTRSDQIVLGQTQAAAATNKETADAQRRASDAMVNTGDVDDLLDGLSAGKF